MTTYRVTLDRWVRETAEILVTDSSPTAATEVAISKAKAHGMWRRREVVRQIAPVGNIEIVQESQP